MENLTYEEFIQNILNTRGRHGCGEQYHEKHHILPKCMGGGNEEENLIDLFAREHFEAHRILALENPENNKLVYAWNVMAFPQSKLHNYNRYELTAEEYEEVRKSFSKTITGKNNPNYGNHKMAGANHPMYGKHHSDETKKKISEATKGENHYMFGKHHSEEARKKISESHKGESNPSALRVVQYNLNGNLINVWAYIKQAADELGIHNSCISKCCKGKLKTAGGYKCYYLYDQIQKDGTIIPGAITLGLITEKEALRMLEEQKETNR